MVITTARTIKNEEMLNLKSEVIDLNTWRILNLKWKLIFERKDISSFYKINICLFHIDLYSESMEMSSL